MMHYAGLESHKEPTCFKAFEGLDEFPYPMHKEFAGICATIEGIDQPLQWQTKVMGGPSKFPSSFSFA
jgi:hypothetical protein